MIFFNVFFYSNQHVYSNMIIENLAMSNKLSYMKYIQNGHYLPWPVIWQRFPVYFCIIRNTKIWNPTKVKEKIPEHEKS